MNEAAPGEAGDGELTEDQSRRLAQIQVIGVIVLIVGGLLLHLPQRSSGVDQPGGVLIVLMLGWLAARAQQRPYPNWLGRQRRRSSSKRARPKEWLHCFGHRQ